MSVNERMQFHNQVYPYSPLSVNEMFHINLVSLQNNRSHNQVKLGQNILQSSLNRFVKKELGATENIKKLE